ncbi:MAG: hypothetical protein ABIH25_03805 [Candidatus Woesearchaeota archaeon]
MTQYSLQGNVIVEDTKNLPKIGNLLFDDLGKEVIAKFNKRFEGVDGIEYTQKYETNEPVSYSNIPRDQSGLRWLYRDRDIGLSARGDYLLNANDTCRVQIYPDQKGLAQKLE